VNHGHLEIVRLLLDLGADVDERVMLQELEEPTLSWGMPLWHAAWAGNFDICKLLLDRGADPNGNVYASGWPLSRAWNHEDESVKQLLFERGAKMQPYMIAQIGDVSAARQLLAESPEEEVISEILWSAADHGHPRIVELALPYIKWPRNDPRWHWVLMQPARGASRDSSQNQGHFASLELLLQAGIDANVSRYGQTILHFTAASHSDLNEADRARFASILIDYGARLDLRDDLLKSTPLGWACRLGRKDMARVLLERGAPAQEAEAEPWATPKAWAEKGRQEAILALLAEYSR
jgi:ankyrin repeat protein